MFDFRLQVFHTVAKRLNFTKAAEELFITQPAVTKHIQEIENGFKVKLFERNGTKIKLTAAGDTLLQYTEELFAVYRKLEFEMNAFTQTRKGQLRIGASRTAAPYVLPPIMAAFHKKFPDIKITLVTGNTEQIEQLLLNKEIDLGIVEGYSRKPAIKYVEFIEDKIVLVANTNNPQSKKRIISLDELKKIPLLLRESGSGTLEIMSRALKPLGIKINQLNIEMQLDSSESMKLYMLHSNCMAFISINAVTKELATNECVILKVKDLNIIRNFYFIQPQGYVAPIPELFMRFAAHYKTSIRIND